MAGVVSHYPVTPTLSISGEGGRGGEERSTSNIIVGKDGAMWFVMSGNRMGRITTTGALTDYPTPDTRTYGITAGSDGAIWSPVLGNNIGRLSRP